MIPSSDQTTHQTPDSQVAQEIVKALQAARLIFPEQAGKVYAGLASGTYEAGDWRLVAEKALEMESADG